MFLQQIFKYEKVFTNMVFIPPPGQKKNILLIHEDIFLIVHVLGIEIKTNLTKMGTIVDSTVIYDIS